MVDIPIDIPLPDSVKENLAKPICIPFPKPEPVEINLPTGGKLKGIADITDKIPSDCSLSFSLLLQLGPFLANLECFIKILALVKPLKDFVEAVPSLSPQKIANAVPDFVKAADDVIKCFLSFTTIIGLACFLADILDLIVKILNCIIGQLKTVLSLIAGLTLQIHSAEDSGNTDLVDALNCAQDNANATAQCALSAFDPILVILSLIEPLLGFAGVSPIEIPPLADAESIEDLENTVTTLEEVVSTIELVSSALRELC